jgi:Ca2+-binding EF-hand superfamily protein
MSYLTKITALFVATFVCFAPFAHADDSSLNKEIAERFAKCDTNKDGKLTMQEAKGCMPRIYDNFSSIDTGKKGYVTVAEIQAVASR